MPVRVDETGIDIAYSCSQKGIACPPGLAPITLSPRAVEQVQARRSTIPTWYLDLKLLDEYYTGAHRYHHTAPISMFYALREALMLIAEEGIENCWNRHRRSHEAFVKGIEALGMHMLVPEPNRVWNLNTPLVPDGIDDAEVRKHLFDNFGIEIPGGFGPLTGKVFRIGLMSSLATKESVAFFLERFAESLAAAGYHAGKAAAL
jgi:alanine-glyoxylate transaminase/serine-glyoxylate transaminase/serine-pyruvate transaminase